jgi:prepilin-type N-terminal cleavage/methylation domain-containing protein
MKRLADAPLLGKVKSIKEKGFTLLELMISIAIIGLIVVITAAAMRLALHSVNSGEKRIDALERMRTSMNVVEAQIQSMTPLTYTDDTGEKKTFFYGEKESLRLSTNYSIWNGQAGNVVVLYEIETDGNGKKLLKATENTIGVSNSRETTLFQSFDSIYFEYFYKGPTDENGNWVEAWTDDTSIPAKIRLHLVLKQNDFSLIIPVRVSLPQAQTAFPASQKPPGSGG